MKNNTQKALSRLVQTWHHSCCVFCTICMQRSSLGWSLLPILFTKIIFLAQFFFRLECESEFCRCWQQQASMCTCASRTSGVAFFSLLHSAFYCGKRRDWRFRERELFLFSAIHDKSSNIMHDIPASCMRSVLLRVAPVLSLCVRRRNYGRPLYDRVSPKINTHSQPF